MQRIPAWGILAGIFTIFWVIFAIVLILAAFPFYVISSALTTIAALSVVIVLLARAYQKNW